MAFCPTLLFWKTKCEEIPATFLGKFVTMQKKKGRVIPPLPNEKTGNLLTSALKAHLYSFPLFKKFWFLRNAKARNFKLSSKI